MWMQQNATMEVSVQPINVYFFEKMIFLFTFFYYNANKY
jgi:hypothetical protein